MTLEFECGGAEVLDVAMVVMRCAFDPRFGEAWNAAQCAGVLALPGSMLIIARAGELPIGFCLVRTMAEEVELMLIAVVPDARGRGVGRALLEEAMTRAQANGALRAFLEVRSDNAAIALYQKSGFGRVGVRANYYRGSDGHLRDAFTFRRDLA